MFKPFSKSISTVEKLNRLWNLVNSGDAMAIVVNADPDALASALALRRLFWQKMPPARIVRINPIDRSDNLAMVRSLDIRLQHIRSLKRPVIDKWALVDSQPSHNPLLGDIDFDIIIDHHPPGGDLNAPFIDIKEEYGATATLMTDYLKAAGITPSARLATALFYAIKTDTANFVRKTVSQDLNAFRFLYDFANLKIIKKIESSEITRDTLESYKQGIQALTFVGPMAVIYLGAVDKPDTLVQLGDFFMKMAEATWSVTAGIYEDTLIVVFRNAGIRNHAGELAHSLLGDVGSAGGHKESARAEVPLGNIDCGTDGKRDCRGFLLKRLQDQPLSRPEARGLGG